MQALRPEPTIAEIDLGIEDDRNAKRPRPMSLKAESVTTIVLPGRGGLPHRSIQVVQTQKKSQAIEVEASASVIDYVVSTIHHEIDKSPKDVVIDSASTDNDESSDEIVEE